MPETFLSGPLNANLDFNLSEGFIIVISDLVVPVQVSAPTDLSSLFPVEEPDFSGIPSVRLPSSATPSDCSTPLMEEQQPPGPQTADSEVGNVLPQLPLESTAVQPQNVASTPDGLPTLTMFSNADVRNRLPPVLLEEFAITPAFADSSETGSAQTCCTSGVASTQPLPQAVVAPQLSLPPTVSQAETEATVATILPEVEIDFSTVPTFATFLEDSEESPAAQAAEGAVLLEIPVAAFRAEPLTTAAPPPLVQPTKEDPTDPRAFFHGAPSQWDDSPTGRILQEARVRAIENAQNVYRVQF